jgi:hypothetical protein
MRRAFWILPVLLVVALAVPLGVGIYHAGVNAGIDQAATSTQIVRVVGNGPGFGFGFFPFGFFLFPLFLFAIFALVRGARWRRFGGPGGHDHWGPGPWKNGSVMAEDWHRRQHEPQGEGATPERGSP